MEFIDLLKRERVLLLEKLSAVQAVIDFYNEKPNQKELSFDKIVSLMLRTQRSQS